MSNVKWLTTITAVDVSFTGYQQTSSYRLRQKETDEGEPVTRMLPRSLMVPPGIPDFFTRTRLVSAGGCELIGRAWSGIAAIARVDVSGDGGTNWAPAELEQKPADAATWVAWRYAWHAEPGNHELCCRATDAEGNTQPERPEWNWGGYTNNAVQRVAVHVDRS
jgi:hypothetical protein